MADRQTDLDAALAELHALAASEMQTLGGGGSRGGVLDRPEFASARRGSIPETLIPQDMRSIRRAPAEGDLFTLWNGDDRMAGLRDPRSLSLREVGSGALDLLSRGSDIASAASATGGPPGAIAGAVARGLRAPQAVADWMGRNSGAVARTGREVADDVAATARGVREMPTQAAKSFRETNVTSGERAAQDAAGRKAAADAEAYATREARISQEINDRYFSRKQAKNQAEIDALRASEEENNRIAQWGRQQQSAREVDRAKSEFNAYQGEQAQRPGTKQNLEFEQARFQKQDLERLDKLRQDIGGEGFRKAMAADPNYALSQLSQYTGRTIPQLAEDFARLGYDFRNYDARLMTRRPNGQVTGEQMSPFDEFMGILKERFETPEVRVLREAPKPRNRQTRPDKPDQ